MKFFVKDNQDKYLIFTDDYDSDEIKDNLHITNILGDLKRYDKVFYPIRIYDDNEKLIKVLSA